MCSEQLRETAPRCTLCPAGCELQLASAGPGAWKIEYPATASSGACPRGSSLGELLGHRRRILAPARREAGRLEPLGLSDALRGIIEAAGGGDVTVLLDGNIPCEQLLAAAAWCRAWPQAKLCFVVEPADEQLLLGTEASRAEYLANGDLAECDGFLIVGDAFAADPACSRGVFDRRRAEARTPIVVIDPAAGTCVKFATHRVEAPAGMEFAALRQLASAAGLDVDLHPPRESKEISSAINAGKALAKCRRLGVLIAAEYGRAAPWRQIGYLAGRIAHALAGGVAPQTVGANALAAVRLAPRLGTISLATALATEPGGGAGSKPAVAIAIGCDILGMLGWGGTGPPAGEAGLKPEVTILAAAASLPNRTTGAAELLLPVTMAGELAGTFLLDGARPMAVSALLAGPAGVLSPADLVGALAHEAGVRPPQDQAEANPAERLDPGAPGPAAAAPHEGQAAPALLLQRDATHAGCGALTAHASWQLATQQPPEARVSPEYARKLNLADLAPVNVSANGQSLPARLRIAPELTGEIVTLSEGHHQARALSPSRIDSENDAVTSAPAAVQLDS